MKRGAEKQLTKDIEEEEEASEPGQGFRKADESVLATRKIRGLPKRVAASQSSSGATTPDTPADPPPAPKFGGFGGFGSFGGISTSTTSSPFSFTAPPKPAAAAPTPGPGASSLSVFSSAPSSTPALSPSATSAAKTFASFLGPKPESKPITNGATTNGVHAQNGVGAYDGKLKAEISYYLTLRGLNVSFVDAITKAVELDPFVDLAGALEKYKSFRSKAKDDYDDSIKKANPPTTVTSPSIVSPFAFGAPNPSSALTPPAVPSSPFGFGAAPSGASERKSTPTMPALPSSFASFNPPLTSTSSSHPGGGFKPQLDSTKSNPFTFGSSGGSTSTPAPLKSPFTFGTPTTVKNPFGDNSSKPTESLIFPSNTPSVFSSNLFSGDTSKEGNKDDSKATSSTSVFGGSVFGEQPAALIPTTKPPFGGAPSSKPSPFAFGSSAGSIGNPIGFTFGSPPRTPDEPSSTTASSSKFALFPSGGPSAQPKTAENSEAGGDTEGSSRAETPASDAPPPIGGSSAHDLEGEGEEDEETKHEIRCKVYRLAKKDTGQTWTDVGIGMLRVKAHKETGTRRLLLRNSSTGKITINFNIYKGMNPTVSKNTVSFMGHDEGNPVPFNIRVKTSDQAEDLRKALDREIEFVKSKSD